MVTCALHSKTTTVSPIVSHEAILARTCFYLRVIRGAAGIRWVTQTVLLGDSLTVWFEEPDHEVALRTVAAHVDELMTKMVQENPDDYVAGSALHGTFNAMRACPRECPHIIR